MKNAQTIASLKAAGLQVKISHRRPVRVRAPKGLLTRADLDALHGNLEAEFAERGGKTVVTLLDREGEMVGTGEAVCRQNESFNRSLGLSAALGRAIKDMNGSRKSGVGALPPDVH